MIDLQGLIDRISSWGAFGHQYWALEWPLPPVQTAWIAILAGCVLALWGARLLRAIYVLALMVLGASIGIHIARQLEVDPLIGLVLGAGLLGLLGHILYRWLVGLTTGLCMALLVAAIGASWLPDRMEVFADDLLAGAKGQRIFTDKVMADGPKADVTERGTTQLVGPQEFVIVLAEALWEEKHQELTKLGILMAAAILLGMGLGVVLPRFTTIIGTSVIGVMALTMGVGSLLALYLPSLWNSVLANTAWFLGGIGLLLLVSLAFQARHGRLREVVSASAPAAQTG